MPQLGETVTEGTITRWMKAVGDHVERDEPLFEVSTDKVDSEVPSPAAGVLTEIIVPEGETVEVGARLGVIADAVPSTPAPPAPAAPTAPPPAEAAPPPAGGPGPTPGPARGGSPALEDARLLSPVVRRLLSDNAIDPGEVTGTGIGGRVTREDVLRAIDERHAAARAAAPAASVPAAPAASVPAAPATPAGEPRQAEPPRSEEPATAAPTAPEQAVPVAPEPPMPVAARPSPPRPATSAMVLHQSGDRVVPFSNMRRRTAEHMVRSKATSPHAFIANEVDFENVERVRKAWGDRFRSEEGFSLTYLPFIARSAVEALRDFPHLNASVADDALVIHQSVNLGVAVDLDHEGLIVPVVHRAEEITLRGIARRIRDLADRARNRQLTADDIVGGTFSITNDGPFGTYFTVPIINQPQVAILATDGIKRRPVVVTLPDGAESIAIHSTGVLGMSWDHRAVDGAYVSSFLRRMAELLGTRDWAAEL